MKGMKLPNIKELYGHLHSLFNGKIGELAKELAEELSKDITDMMGMGMGTGEDKDGKSGGEGGEVGEAEGEGKGQCGSGGEKSTMDTSKDMVQGLLKNPEKMIDLIKKVSNKLNDKINKGEVSQEDLMKEATDILGKMKNMGDMKDMLKSFSKMAGLGGGGGAGGKTQINTNALNGMLKKNNMREKLKQRMLKKQMMQQAQQVQQTQKSEDTTTPTATTPSTSTPTSTPKILPTEDPHRFTFKVEGEEAPSSSAIPQPTQSKKNKKNKKKSNK